tara:strand:- start:9436 stop:9669 length:234 start_codon:yes stop_codon:yes gene_type:complete
MHRIGWLVLFSAVFISGCGGPDVEDFIADRDLLKTHIADCGAMTPEDATADKTCSKVIAALQIIASKADAAAAADRQ